MALLSASDIKFYLSGGAGNAAPNASLGGVISSTQIVDATLNNIFDAVTGAEVAAGIDTEYRCIYVKNASADSTNNPTLYSAKVWIADNTTTTPGGGSTTSTDQISIGLDPAGVSGTATTVVDESTAPAGVTFSQPTSGAPISIGDIPRNGYIAVWVKRTVPQNEAAKPNVDFQITVQGDSD